MKLCGRIIKKPTISRRSIVCPQTHSIVSSVVGKPTCIQTNNITLQILIAGKFIKMWSESYYLK